MPNTSRKDSASDPYLLSHSNERITRHLLIAVVITIAIVCIAAFFGVGQSS